MSMFPAPLVCGVGSGLRGCEETTFQTECGQLLDSICANCELEAGSWLMMDMLRLEFNDNYEGVEKPARI